MGSYNLIINKMADTSIEEKEAWDKMNKLMTPTEDQLCRAADK